MSNAALLCRLADIADPGSLAFSIGDGDWPLRGFLVRQGAEVFAYVNRCPHAGHPLNWRPDDFLTPDHTLIMCRSHGALFETRDGRCVAGPCVGRSLQALNVRIENEVVLLDEDQELDRFV
jgi:nitrite reductase/ring-hydroxylating ferredoxin subunit